MGLKDLINQTTKPNTIKSLKIEFKELGIEVGDIIIVHSSMSKLGWIVGGSVAVIDALMEVVTKEGTIIMPTQTSSNTDPKDWQRPPVPEEWHDLIRENYPPYRPQLTPSSGVGVMPELFRKYPNVLRSDHPTVSFAAWGKEAANIISNHLLEFGLGEGSPLEKIYDLDGKILLLGVGHDTNTSLHLAEDRAKFSSKITTHQSSVILKNGKRERVEWEELDLDTEDFEEIGKAFDSMENQEFLIKGKIGNANSILLNQRKLIDFAVNWMESNRK